MGALPRFDQGLARFERLIGGAVEGGFARVFRSRVEPVELTVALKKEADGNRAVGPARIVVPNAYEVVLGPSDYLRLAPYRLAMGDELAEVVRLHAREQGYTFLGPVEVALVRAENLRVGSYRIRSRVQSGSEPVRVVQQPFRPPLGETAALPRTAPRHAYGRLELPDGARVEVGSEPIVVGRGLEADVRLAERNVSRRHAQFRVDGLRVLVEDLGSTNGTTVNGETIARAVLVDGDRITLGVAATIIFRAEPGTLP